MIQRTAPPDWLAKLRGTILSLMLVAGVGAFAPTNRIIFVLCFAVTILLILFKIRRNVFPLSFGVGVLAILIVSFSVRFSS